MTAILTTLKDKTTNNTLYPTTKTNAITDSNGTDLDSILAGKQSTLTFDNTPTQNSTNPVTSGGVYSALKKIGTSISDLYSGNISANSTITLSNSTDNYDAIIVIGCDQTNGSKVPMYLPISEYNTHIDNWSRLTISTDAGWVGLYKTSSTTIRIVAFSGNPSFNYLIVRGMKWSS